MLAPHYNDQVRDQLRAGQNPTTLPLVLGRFDIKGLKTSFEYAERRWPDDAFAPDMPHMVYVGSGKITETRLAKVLQTVAYVVVDEDANGQPVIQKWDIVLHRKYDTQWVRA